MSQHDPILGIDLGTTYSAMAFVNDHGHPEIIPNADGHLTTASVIYFYDQDEWVVGDEAMKMIIVDSQNVARHFKGDLGRDGAEKTFYNQNYNPIQLQTILLDQLRKDAVSLLGSRVKDAVITVPAHFNSAQRAATQQAGTEAGFTVQSIINEPTAAAVAFGLDRLNATPSSAPQRFLVFDLGGGTLDVTVMQIAGKRLTSISTAGRANLGGVNFDDRLVGSLLTTFTQQFGFDLREHPVPFQELYERCLLAKISLSTKQHAMIPVYCQGKRTVVKVTRSGFEQMCVDLLSQCAATTDEALKKAKLTAEQLDDVLLVGGATRMPMVHDLIQHRFSRLPNVHTHPDHTVAHGAALAAVYRHRPDHPALQEQSPVHTVVRTKSKRAAPPLSPAHSSRGAMIGLADGGHRAQRLVNGSQSLTPFEIYERASTTLGMIVLNREHQEQVVPLIIEGTLLPAIKKARFVYAYDGMTAVRVEVTEGTGQSREYVRIVGKVELTGLPPRPQGTPLEVIYEYGHDQILRVNVIDIETGAENLGHIRFTGGATSLPEHPSPTLPPLLSP